jgi:hypothetical protein
METSYKAIVGKKLKVLCFHGYNSSGDIFDYQLKAFKAQYAEAIEFHMLTAPHIIEGDHIPQYFVDLGFPPPYKTWYKVSGWKEAWGNKTEGIVKYSGLEESIEILV